MSTTASCNTSVQGQERGRNDAPLHVGCQEGGHVVSYLCGHWVDVFEGARLIGYVAFHHAHYLFGVNLHIGCAYPVVHMHDGDGLTVGRVLQFIHVVQVFGIGTVEGVVFQYHVLGQAGRRGTDASGRGEVGLAGVGPLFQVAHLKDGPIHFSHKPVAHLLCHLAQVDIVVCYLSQVDVLAEVGVGSVGRAVLDGLRIGQVSVGALPGGCSGEDAHLEGASCLVFGHCYLRQFLGHGLGGTRGCESAQCYVLSILNQCRCFCGRQSCVSHFRLISLTMMRAKVLKISVSTK